MSTQTTRRWQHKVRLGDIWNDDLSFPDLRDHVVARLKRLPQFDEIGESGDEELWNLVDELADAQDADDFDIVWDDIYDWADTNRVWIDIWGAK